MKKLVALILCCVFVLPFAACADEQSVVTTTASTETQCQTTTSAVDLKTEIEKQMEKINFEGIVYLTHNGEIVYCQANGQDEKGRDMTIDTPMYIGSVSKQFCASAIMKLSEEGKLSLTDTLDKYFPEYEIGKDITIKNLLSMRSGVYEITKGAEDYFDTEKTEEENLKVVTGWIFSEPLDFEPDTKLEYSNTNYLLLGLIVEQVTGQYYESFIREEFFEPLGMTNTGFVSEVETNSYFSESLSYDTFFHGENAKGLLKGMGDIVSTAPDMDKWMTALKSGEVVSMESFEKMTEDYSPDYGKRYGFGLEGMYKGIGHGGLIGDYWSLDYMNTEEGYNLFAVGLNAGGIISRIPELIMSAVLEE